MFPLFAYSETKVVGYRISDKENGSRIVLDLSENPKYNVFSLSNPPRVVIDIADGNWQKSNYPSKSTRRIKEIRHAVKQDKTLRIVVDYNISIDSLNSFVLKRDDKNKDRLVVDILNGYKQISSAPIPISKDGKSVTSPKPRVRSKNKPVIIVDAGHGGHDPGAIGRRGTKEKKVTLSYAKELARQLKKTGRYKVHLTRNSDKYIKLRDRVKKARKLKGDLFISVHADSHKNKKIRGLSIYTLSETASDKEAAALAKRENNSDIIPGIEFEDKEISGLLVDLVQRDSMNISANFAENIVKSLQSDIKLLHNPHRFAGFRVLTAAEIPSVLIEIGYLSNRREEKLLNSKKHKKKLASKIVKAIDSHFKKYNVNNL